MPTPPGLPTANLTLWPTETPTREPTSTPRPIRSATPDYVSTAAAENDVIGLDSDRPATATNAPCRLETYSDVTIRDGTNMQPGEIFLKIWRFDHVGTCSFTTDNYYLVFDGGEQMGGPQSTPVLFYSRRTDLQLELGEPAWEQQLDKIFEGQFVDLPMLLRAPDEPGRYRGYWKIIDGRDGSVLEDDFWVEVRVDEPKPGDDQSAHDWGGAWINSDPSRTDQVAFPLSLTQEDGRVNGFTYASDGRLFLIEGQVSEDGQTVVGLFGEPWTQGQPFQWTLLENQDQFQGLYLPVDFDAVEWCGGRVGQTLPDPCAPE